jgi:hypothetical protein
VRNEGLDRGSLKLKRTLMRLRRQEKRTLLNCDRPVIESVSVVEGQPAIDDLSMKKGNWQLKSRG